jgi:hypothetical protein
MIGSRRSGEKKIMPNCPKHPKTKMICPACIAQRAGTSAKKARSSARNGRLGGRPPQHSPDCDVQATGHYSKGCPRCIYDARKFTPAKRRTA